ncbi:MAG: L-serine ammonia-lyase [Ilumatobacter sp.]
MNEHSSKDRTQRAGEVGPVSVFDMLKIGVGPSSSHTLGPWRAALYFVERLRHDNTLDTTESVRVEFFGSLAKTGRGHGTGIAVMMGLSGHDPEVCDVEIVQQLGPATLECGSLLLGGSQPIPFVRDRDVVFDTGKTLPGHPNAMRFTAVDSSGVRTEQTSYSIGGGFVDHEAESTSSTSRADASCDERVQQHSASVAGPALDHPIVHAADLLQWCGEFESGIAAVVRANERRWRSDERIDIDLLRIRDVMRDCIFRGVSTRGTLPGGLDVARRAASLHDSLLGDPGRFANSAEWFESVRRSPLSFDDTVQLVSCLALAVNEENAAFGRVVTAPTNGAAGVLPAVLFHHLASLDPDVWSERDIDAESVRFLLVAAEIGSLFKKGATISAAMGGCQAEIGVSSAMAAAALSECRGATAAQSLMAAEIAMEHHLGLTCDPIGGLVQVPCIERNAMGAMKAISASHLARASDPALARVSLDDVIDTMWSTAQDMNVKYKETAEGGLATRIPVSVVEC